MNTTTQPAKRLLDQIRDVIRLKHYSIRTEQAYCDWIKRFILFHGKKHPIMMGHEEVAAFLTWLAVKQKVSASTQNQALNAIVFLYKQVLKQDPGDFSHALRAKQGTSVPTVLTCTEVKALIQCLSGTHQLIVKCM